VDDVLESYEAYTAEKAKNPYAIGMASAMKTTGDKPPLKKSTINKAHKIAKGIDESDEAMSGTYARVIYDYSEDFGMITLYNNGNKIDEWSDYFGANTVGNPLAAKFVEIAKKNNLNPEGMSIVDDEGEKGTFGDNTFNWDQFAKDKTGMNEAESKKFGVYKTGGSVGEKNTGKPIKSFATKQEAADHAKSLNAGLSKGEKESYKIKYTVKSISEAAKPDFLDMDKDGDKKEPMKKAVKDKEKVSESIAYLKRLAGL
jgi:hypothetical protein